MSQAKKFIGTNPFMPLDPSVTPSVTKTDYNKDSDAYIIEYAEVDHIVRVGDKDTDFVIDTRVEESSRVKRDTYIKSYAADVGILNILEKVRKTGDISLFNQVDTPVHLSDEKDALGRPVQEIIDITRYQVDKVDAFESFKKGAISFEELPEDLKGKLTMSEVANLSDEEILAYVNKVRTTNSTKEKGSEE